MNLYFKLCVIKHMYIIYSLCVHKYTYLNNYASFFFLFLEFSLFFFNIVIYVALVKIEISTIKIRKCRQIKNPMIKEKVFIFFVLICFLVIFFKWEKEGLFNFQEGFLFFFLTGSW